MVSPQPEHGVEEPAVEDRLGEVVDHHDPPEVEGFPVLHEPRPGLPHQDVVGGGEEEGGPDGGHQQPVITPFVSQLVDGV